MVTRTFFARPVRAFFLLALLIFAPTPQSISGQTTDETAAPAGAAPTLLTSSADGVRFSLTPGLPAIQPAASAGAGYQTISLEGFLAQEIAGQPALPQLGVSIALPPGAVPVARLVESEQTTLAVTRLAPAVERTLVSYDADDPASVPEFAERYSEDAGFYQTNAYFPASVVTLGQEGTLRDQRFVAVLIRPVQYNPVQGQLLTHTQLEIQVDFLYPDGRPALTAPRPESPTFERLMAGTLLNYADARQWRETAITIPNSPQTSPCMDANAFRITVTQTGIHQLTYAELVTAGFPNNGTIPDNKIRMCHLADEIDIRIDNQNGSATFGGNDAVLFYGEQLHTQETDQNIYWLTYSTNGPNGQRMSNASAAPGGATASSRYRYTQRLEANVEYLSTFPMTDENDHWYWDYIYHGDAPGLNTHLDAPFTLSDKATGSYTVPISVNVSGHNLVKKHVFSVTLNGAVLGTVNFTDSGRNQTYTFDFTADASQLLSGSNLITVTALDNGVAGQEHIVWINWIDVSPSRQYVAQNGRLVWDQPDSGNWSYAISGLNSSALALDVTDPMAPKLITGVSGSSTINFAQQISNPARYAISTTTGRLSVAAISHDTLPAVPLQASTNHADYIYISDPSLYLPLNSLVSYRQSEGYTVFVASVQDI
ncbi:MAG: hypothetical protein KDE28_21270, partial [Anaerolineales bacterium]|nr:hypothetical protein [Anaerolineales bacterium]